MTAGKKLLSVLFLSTLISTPTFLSQGAWAGSKMSMPMNMPMPTTPTTAPKAPAVAKASTPVAPKVATPAKAPSTTSSYKVAVGVKYASQKVTLQLKTKVGSKTTKTTIGSFTADSKGFVVIPKLTKPASYAQLLVVVGGKQVNSFSASLIKPATTSLPQGSVAAPFVAPTAEPTPTPTPTAEPTVAPTPVQTAQPVVPAPVVTPTPTVADALVPQFGTINLTNEGYTMQITNYDPAFTWKATDTSGALVTISKTGLVTVVYNGLPGKVTISTSRTDYKPSSVAAPTVSINGAAAPAAPAAAPAAAAAAPAAAPAAAAPSPSASSAPASPAPAAIVAPHFALTVPNKVITIGSSVTNGYLINTSGGPVDSYLIFPAAPAGTSFDAATGLLSGTPTNQQAATQYQITGVNTSGIFQVIYTLTVNARPSASSGTAANIIRLGSLKAMRVGAADQVIPGLASSNLPIVYTTSNSAVCEIVTGTSLVHAKAAGDCQIIANQAGNGTYGQANSVTSAVFTVIAANDTRWIVVLDPNGGLNNGSSAITWQLVARGSSITLPAGLTNLPGYTTYLWLYDSVANVNTAAPTFIPTADTTLVAKWS